MGQIQFSQIILLSVYSFFTEINGIRLRPATKQVCFVDLTLYIYSGVQKSKSTLNVEKQLERNRKC